MPWSSLSKEPHTGGEYVMAYLRLAGLPGFIHALSRYPQENLPVAIWFAASELAPIVARAFHKLKTLREGRAVAAGLSGARHCRPAARRPW